MKRLFSLKFLSEIPKSLSQSHPNPTNFHCISSSHPLSRTTANRQSHLLISPFFLKPSSLLSPPHQWRSPKLSGVVSNPILAKHFVSSAHLKSSIKSLVGPRVVGFLRTQFPKTKISHWSSSQKRSWSSWSQGFSTDNVVLGLILANAAVFMLWRVLDQDFMVKNFMISVDNIKSGRVHTLITSAFSHHDIGHIVTNMLGLYFFGNNIGRVFGAEYLLKLYFAGAVVGSIFYLVQHAYLSHMSKNQGTFFRDPSKIPGLGASGAVNAIMLLDIFLFPKATLYLEFIIPVPAILLGIFIIGKDVLRIIEGDPQVSGAAHLGGAVVAAAAWLRLKRRIRF